MENPGGAIPPALSHIALPLGLVLLVAGLAMMVASRRHHKVIVVLLSAAVGWYGALSLMHTSPTMAVIYAAVGTLAGLLLLGIMRLAVVLVSAAVGALFGAAVWTTLHSPPDLWWMAAAAGCILLGLVASLLYDRAVILLCTMLGAGCAVVGAGVILLHCGYAKQVQQICGPRSQWPWRLATIILMVSLVSVLLQLLDAPARDNSKDA
jgi:hypothetical protein